MKNKENVKLPDRILALALDLDRTTLLPDGSLSVATRDALLGVLDKGIEVIIASGRPYSALPRDVVEIPGIRYAVTSNGACVFDLTRGTCIHRYTLNPQSVDRILELTASHDLTFEGFICGQAYAERCYVEDPMKFGATVHGATYIPATRKPVDHMRRFLAEHREDLESIDLVTLTEEDKEYWWKLLAEEVPDLYLTSSVPRLLEISHRDGGKHSGTGFVLERLGIDAGYMAAFGDAANDIDLLQFAGVGIAVANASEACKETADYVTKSNAEDGVAWALREILKLI